MPKQGVLHTDISLSPLYGPVDGVVCHPLRKAYGWLAGHMEEKVGKPEGALYLWWVWHTRREKHRKPDLREAGYGQRGEKLVCLELKMPDKEVILSDFDLWCLCISDFRIPGAIDSDEAEMEKEEVWYKSLGQEEQERMKLNSWEALFDVEPGVEGPDGTGSWIQAAFWELRLANVRKVVYFTAR